MELLGRALKPAWPDPVAPAEAEKRTSREARVGSGSRNSCPQLPAIVVAAVLARSAAAWMLVGPGRSKRPPDACCVALYTKRRIAARNLESKFELLPFGSFRQPVD